MSHENDFQKKAVGYVRVSTKRQLEGTSIGEQKRRIKAHCVGQLYDFKRFFEDNASASTEHRPQYQAMLADAQAHAFDIIVVLSIDRFSRNTSHFLQTFDKLEEWDIGFVSVSQNIDTDSDLGDFTIKLLSLLADFERKTIRARTKSGRVASFRDGNSFLGSVPYGYLWDRENKKIVPHEEHAKVYNEIVDLYLLDHLSTTGIAERFTMMEYETPGSRRNKNKKSTRWSDDMIRRMLHHTAYYGEATYLKDGYKQVISADGHPYFTKQAGKPNSSGPITIKFPKLISRKKWDDIQKRIEYNKIKPKKIRKKDAVDKFLTSNTLGGHFICNSCGTIIRAKVYLARSGKEMHQYGCSRHLMSNRQLKNRNKTKCSMPALKADDFDFEVWDAVITILSNPMKYLREWILPNESKSSGASIDQLRRKKVKNQNRLDRITDLIVDQSNKRLLKSYQKKQRELSAAIDYANAEIDIKKRERKVEHESIQYIKKLLEEAELAVDKMEDIISGNQLEDIEDVVIPTIYNSLEKIKSYDVKREILDAVVSPEQGGIVKMAFDDDTGQHEVIIDAKLNYLRTVRIIKALRDGTLADGSIYNPNQLKQRL